MLSKKKKFCKIRNKSKLKLLEKDLRMYLKANSSMSGGVFKSKSSRYNIRPQN
jgi:hypothetical protein